MDLPEISEKIGSSGRERMEGEGRREGEGGRGGGAYQSEPEEDFKFKKGETEVFFKRVNFFKEFKTVSNKILTFLAFGIKSYKARKLLGQSQPNTVTHFGSKYLGTRTYPSCQAELLWDVSFLHPSTTDKEA